MNLLLLCAQFDFFAMKYQLWYVQMRERQFHVRNWEIFMNSHGQSQKNR